MLSIADERLDRAFAALADPTRRAILARLASGEATVNDVARPFAISAPAISRHLRVLESAGLIVRRRDGPRRHLRLDPTALKTAAEWIDFYRRFWNESFDQLDEHLKSTTNRKDSHAGRKAKRK